MCLFKYISNQITLIAIGHSMLKLQLENAIYRVAQKERNTYNH